MLICINLLISIFSIINNGGWSIRQDFNRYGGLAMKTVIINYQALISEQGRLKGVERTKTSASNIGWGYNLLLNLYERYRGAYGSSRKWKKIVITE